MEIKRPDEITKADIPYIEGTIFAKGRIRSILEEGHGRFAHGITGLSELLEKKHKKDSSYSSQGMNDPFEKGLDDDFLQAKYLIVFDKNDLAVRVGKLYTLFVNNTASHIETDNDWQQFSFADSRDAHIRLEGILNRIYENRLPYDSDIYGFAGGAGSGRTEVAKPEDIVLSPEPWPKEKTQEDAPAEKTTQEHEETLLEAIKEYLGRVARGEILKENLARYEDLLERSRAGDIQANRDMINEFAGFGGIAKVRKLAKGTKSVDAVKNGKVVGDLKGLTPAEREFVDELVSQGKQVEIIPRGSGKTADFLIDGVETELKTVNRLGTNTVKNAIQTASKQGENILIDARGTSLTKADALNQINRAQGSVGGLEGRVTILTGDGSVNF